MEIDVIHYDTGEGYLLKMGGRHTICLCGMWFQDSCQENKDKHTIKKEDVTCPNCLKKLNNGKSC
jgi:hypothetical protein